MRVRLPAPLRLTPAIESLLLHPAASRPSATRILFGEAAARVVSAHRMTRARSSAWLERTPDKREVGGSKSTRAHSRRSRRATVSWGLIVALRASRFSGAIWGARSIRKRSGPSGQKHSEDRGAKGQDNRAYARSKESGSSPIEPIGTLRSLPDAKLRDGQKRECRRRFRIAEIPAMASRPPAVGSQANGLLSALQRH